MTVYKTLHAWNNNVRGVGRGEVGVWADKEEGETGGRGAWKEGLWWAEGNLLVAVDCDLSQGMERWISDCHIIVIMTSQHAQVYRSTRYVTLTTSYLSVLCGRGSGTKMMCHWTLVKRSLQDPGVHKGTMGIATVGGRADNCTTSGSASGESDRLWHLELYMVVAFGNIQQINLHTCKNGVVYIKCT